MVGLVVVVPTLVLAAGYATVRRTRTHHAAQAAETPEAAPASEPHETVVRHVLSFENRPPPPQPPLAPQTEASDPQPAVEKTPAELGAALEAAFRADAPPDHKAKELSESVSSALREPAAHGMTLDSVECHATRCRLAVQFDDESSDKRVLPEFFSLLVAKGIDVQGMRFVVPIREPAPDGKIHATIHVFWGDG
jgi:hypothetical protein